MVFEPQVIGDTKGVLPEVMEKLKEISKKTGKPVTITPGGGFRKKLPGETGESAHYHGLAADIEIPGYKTEQIADIMREFGFTGVGCYYNSDGTQTTFAHGDIRGHAVAKDTHYGRGEAHGVTASWVRGYRLPKSQDPKRKSGKDFKNKEEWQKWQRKHGIKPSPPAEKAPANVRKNNQIVIFLMLALILIAVVAIIWSQGGGGGGVGGGGAGAQTWTITTDSGHTATLTVDSSGSFTGTGWMGSTPSGSYSIPITDGSMYGTTMTFTANASYDSGQGTIQETGYGTLDATFPDATSASGTCDYTISDPLGDRSGSLSWTATRVS
jgi:hypothetical protein